MGVRKSSRRNDGVATRALGPGYGQRNVAQMVFGFQAGANVFGMMGKMQALRVAARNNSTIWRRILVRHQGTSAGAYRDMRRRM
jgi:hypothetical protein